MKTAQNYQIHTLTVNTSGEKQLFQIKLPRNAKKITGILITVTPASPPKGRPKEPVPTDPIIEFPVRAEFATDVAATIKPVTPAPLIPIEHAI